MGSNFVERIMKPAFNVSNFAHWPTAQEIAVNISISFNEPMGELLVEVTEHSDRESEIYQLSHAIQQNLRGNIYGASSAAYLGESGGFFITNFNNTTFVTLDEDMSNKLLRHLELVHKVPQVYALFCQIQGRLRNATKEPIVIDEETASDLVKALEISNFNPPNVQNLINRINRTKEKEYDHMGSR